MNALNDKVLKYIEAKQQGKNTKLLEKDIRKFLTKNSVYDKIRININTLLNNDIVGGLSNNINTTPNTFVIVVSNKYYEMIKNGLYIFMDDNYTEFPLKTIVIGSRRLQVTNMMELFESDDLEYIYITINSNKYCFVSDVFENNILTHLNMTDKNPININTNTISETDVNNNKSRSYKVSINHANIYYNGQNNQPTFSKFELYFAKK
jgi:hypothetical protein